jgi:prevent-host-death family protein
MVDGSFYSSNFFDLIMRPQTIPNCPNKCRLRGLNLARLNPALQGYLVYSNSFCCFLCRILAINQGYTYSNIFDLSRKISAMSIAAFPRYKGGAVYNHLMAKDVIHISDAEAANDFASLLDRVSAGAEVIIERNSRPVAVVRSAEAPRGRLLSESIALAEAHAKELGYEPTMDADFAADLKEIINSRKPRDLSAWD